MWAAKHNKHYSAVEALRRRAIYNMNAKLVARLNKENTFSMSVNGPFAAMTTTEYNNMLKPIHVEQSEVAYSDLKDVPESLDWRAEGKIPAIRDQAQCGSCYTFSSVQAVEGRLLIAGSKQFNVNTLDLSEQQLVDCSKETGNKGCNGGSLLFTFRYIKLNGLMKESDYKYEAKELDSCKYDKSKVVVKISGQKTVPSGNEEELKKAVAEGPVAVAIDASGVKFQLYNGGVYDNPSCSSTQLNHGVGAVGYGNTNGQDYWIVRNSWGESWGDKGYILMSRNKNNQCGIASGACYPTGVSDA
jgi:histolysain